MRRTQPFATLVAALALAACANVSTPPPPPAAPVEGAPADLGREYCFQPPAHGADRTAWIDTCMPDGRDN